MEEQTNAPASERGFRAFLKRKQIEISPKRYFIDAMGSMALALFATLLMSSILGTLGDLIFGAASKTDPGQIKIAPISRTTVCPLAARVRHMVRGAGLSDFPAVYSTESPAPVVGHAKNLGSIICVTGVFGLMMANFVIGEIIRNI